MRKLYFLVSEDLFQELLNSSKRVRGTMGLKTEGVADFHPYAKRKTIGDKPDIKGLSRNSKVRVYKDKVVVSIMSERDHNLSKNIEDDCKKAINYIVNLED